MDHLEISRHGRVLTVALNRPEKLNALTAAMQENLLATIRAADTDPDVSVVVVKGNGRAFSSGADLNAAASTTTGPRRSVRDAAGDMAANRKRVGTLLNLWSSSKPLIAQVHGYCIGTANEIVGAADLVVCGESTKMGMPEAREFALPPTLGFWPARIGPSRTKELLFTGRWLTGHEAVDYGLAIAVLPDEELDTHVEELSARIAEVPVSRLAVCKQAVNEWAEASGFRTAALRGAEYHAIFHQSSSWEEKLRKTAD